MKKILLLLCLAVFSLSSKSQEENTTWVGEFKVWIIPNQGQLVSSSSVILRSQGIVWEKDTSNSFVITDRYKLCSASNESPMPMHSYPFRFYSNDPYGVNLFAYGKYRLTVMAVINSVHFGSSIEFDIRDCNYPDLCTKFDTVSEFYPQAGGSGQWIVYDKDGVGITLPAYSTVTAWSVLQEPSYVPVTSGFPLPPPEVAFSIQENHPFIEWAKPYELEDEDLGFELHRSKFENSGYFKLNESLFLGVYSYLDTEIFVGAGPVSSVYYRAKTATPDGHVTSPLSSYVYYSGRMSYCKIGAEGTDQSSTLGKDETESKVYVYPNPANPSSILRYSLDRPSFVSIRIYDLMGRLVEDVNVGQRTPGDYSHPLNLSSLSSGTYICRVMSIPEHSHVPVFQNSKFIVQK